MVKKNKLSVLILGLVVIIGFGCGSKKKQEDETLSGSGVDSSSIAFDSLGSDSGKIEGLNTVFFEYDKSTLTKDSLVVLGRNAEWLKKNSSVNLQVEGHCDSRGSIEYNLALGERRAKAVQSQLIRLGVPASRLSVVSYGKERPLVMGDTEDAYSRNRRANFVPLR